MHKRLIRLCIKTGGLLGAGLFYALLCILAGHPLIPCMFHTITGLYCPGCGVSRMCLSLLSLDFQSAFQANAAVMLILPPGLIKSGRLQPTRAQNQVLYIMAGFLLLFGILRNLPAFAWLSP